MSTPVARKGQYNLEAHPMGARTQPETLTAHTLAAASVPTFLHLHKMLNWSAEKYLIPLLFQSAFYFCTAVK